MTFDTHVNDKYLQCNNKKLPFWSKRTIDSDDHVSDNI